MARLESKDIIQVVDALVGYTGAVGDSVKDDMYHQNLKTLIDVTNWCLDSIMWAAQSRGYEASVVRQSMTATGALMEYRQWIDSILKESD